jgi:NADH dehydrogenase (ubiquinone) Fe-S protein 7
MLSSKRSAAALALRGASSYISKSSLATKANHLCLTVKPASALIPYQSVAAISSSLSKPASAIQPHNVPGNPSMNVPTKQRREVPLPSQEGKKGVMQYALYVLSAISKLGNT